MSDNNFQMINFHILSIYLLSSTLARYGEARITFHYLEYENTQNNEIIII